ncbi:MAG: hypothetical protein COA96_16935 [SAR86 cluster bacterium]|uniref:Uncharacterized protein n=1 Tax=SAR86 cluster bacterium TaxID=2030880 RepID=A0A2A5AG84_9GAMM|nr:MAG: hypothetical protein COA96_16935 [SAR86 cluster bacterium]
MSDDMEIVKAIFETPIAGFDHLSMNVGQWYAVVDVGKRYKELKKTPGLLYDRNCKNDGALRDILNHYYSLANTTAARAELVSLIAMAGMAIESIDRGEHTGTSSGVAPIPLQELGNPLPPKPTDNISLDMFAKLAEARAFDNTMRTAKDDDKMPVEDFALIIGEYCRLISVKPPAGPWSVLARNQHLFVKIMSMCCLAYESIERRKGHETDMPTDVLVRQLQQCLETISLAARNAGNAMRKEIERFNERKAGQ